MMDYIVPAKATLSSHLLTPKIFKVLPNVPVLQQALVTSQRLNRDE